MKLLVKLAGLRRRAAWIFLVVACGGLMSCIDGHEEYWLNADGSGRAEIHYEVPASIASGMGGVAGVEQWLDRFIRETPTLTDTKRSVRRDGGRMVVELKTGFKSVLDLVAAVDGESALTAGTSGKLVDPLIGNFDIQRHGRRVVVARTVSPGKALPGSSLMPDSKFEGHNLVYILHLPVAAEASNATRTADGGRTLEWDVPMKEGLEKDVQIRFAAVMPWPRLVLAVAGLLVLALALACGWWFRRRRGRVSALT